MSGSGCRSVYRITRDSHHRPCGCVLKSEGWLIKLIVIYQAQKKGKVRLRLIGMHSLSLLLPLWPSGTHRSSCGSASLFSLSLSLPHFPSLLFVNQLNSLQIAPLITAPLAANGHLPRCSLSLSLYWSWPLSVVGSSTWCMRTALVNLNGGVRHQRCYWSWLISRQS